jgi:nitrite reductase/ring-hydroxylating ferredoxin subunit
MQTNGSRRRFLCVLAGSTLAGVAGCGPAQGVGPEPIGDVSAGNVSDLPVGTLRAVGTVPVAIGRDAGGVYALTLTCSHSGCNMAVDGSVSMAEIDCSCHGSRFDANGNVAKGPAPDPLQHFAVEIDPMGMMMIHGAEYVSPQVRTPVA